MRYAAKTSISHKSIHYEDILDNETQSIFWERRSVNHWPDKGLHKSKLLLASLPQPWKRLSIRTKMKLMRQTAELRRAQKQDVFFFPLEDTIRIKFSNNSLYYSTLENESNFVVVVLEIKLRAFPVLDRCSELHSTAESNFSNSYLFYMC